MPDRGLFIDGAWRPAASGGRLEIRDPTSRDLVGTTALADRADIDAAVSAARRALPHWAAVHAEERARILLRAAALIEDRLPAIADLLTRGNKANRFRTPKRKSASGSK